MGKGKPPEFEGNENLDKLKRISQTKQDEEVQRQLKLGLEAADSINDRSISLFVRGSQPAFAGINTFMRAPYCEDVKQVGEYEAASPPGRFRRSHLAISSGVRAMRSVMPHSIELRLGSPEPTYSLMSRAPLKI